MNGDAGPRRVQGKARDLREWANMKKKVFCLLNPNKTSTKVGGGAKDRRPSTLYAHPTPEFGLCRVM